MREILFRGKRISNGGWVYGGIVSSPHPNYDHPMVYAICSNLMDVFVDQDSIGQYTGLTDKSVDTGYLRPVLKNLKAALDIAKNVEPFTIHESCCFESVLQMVQMVWCKDGWMVIPNED